MEKSVRLLLLLSGKRTYSIEELKERFEVSERTVYRYLNHLEDAGFVLDRTNSRYRLAQDDSGTKALHRLFHFSEEEAYIFYKSLSGFELTNLAVKRLLKKLHALYDFRSLNRLKKDGNIEMIQKLSQAIQSKKCVSFYQYRSSNSDRISDRILEAFEFMSDYAAVWAFDLNDKRVKQFKISRIGELELSGKSWQYEHLHKLPFTDAFRMSAPTPIAEVKAVLSLKAFNLIREEYPIAEKYISKSANQYLLNIPVADFHGIGRFVLGLPGDIQVIEPEPFKKFLKKMNENFYY